MAETAGPKAKEALMAMMAGGRMMAMSAEATSVSAMGGRQGGGGRRSFRRNGYRRRSRTGNEDTSWGNFC